MAFRDIASTSAASTSSSSSTKPFYDVFINHRGKDTKHKLASTIYNMLDLMGVRAFLDQEELEKGDSFPEAIEEAMRTASVHIAIFSPGYVESPWCLEELSFMLRIKVTIIPVFYDVDPSHLRFVRKGMYAAAFGEHERKLQHGGERRYKPEKINEWEEALRQVSYLSGFTVDGDKCDHGKLLREILETAIDKMKKLPLEFARSPIGLEEVVQDFESEVGSSTGTGNVHIVGIVGMGGSGKTTLAKELYNRKCSPLSRSSFLPNVRDAASTNSLHKLQEKLLKDLRIQHPPFDNIDEGMAMLVKHLQSMTLLIVLDDVDDRDQMDALLPERMMHNLGRASFIIVTTRHKDVLTSWGISDSCIYHIKMLSTYKAKQLFCRYAFLKDSQTRFENLLDNYGSLGHLIDKFVDACNGLPLSLKVLGAMMNGKSRDLWQPQLDKISRILPNKIADCLKVSYDALDAEEQQMFLDVACFFIGARKSMVVAICEGSGWSGKVGLETLVNKCLIALEFGRIQMHDHLRDLGRQIAGDVCQSQPSRIWKEEQISITINNKVDGVALGPSFKLLCSKLQQLHILGSRNHLHSNSQDEKNLIRGIAVGLSFPYYDKSFNIYPPPLEHFMEKNRSSLPKLQLLSVKGNDFKKRFAALSRDLVWLRWHDFNGTNLPRWLSFSNIRVLELYNPKNLKELWKDNVQPPLQLRELIIDGIKSTCLRGLPRSIGRLRYLKRLVLIVNDSGMRSLPEEFCHLQSLESLELRNFPGLSSMPHDLGKLINLRSLILSGVQLTALLGSLEALPCLTFLGIEDCDWLECLPEALGRLSNLQNLKIRRTPMVEIGMGIGSPSGCRLNTLTFLSLNNTEVRRISISDNCCPTLQTLKLECNTNLTEIETLPGNVREIRVRDCAKLKKMRGIGGLLNLQELDVRYCRELEMVECGAYMHSVGHTIRITGCPKARVTEECR